MLYENVYCFSEWATKRRLTRPWWLSDDFFSDVLFPTQADEDKPKTGKERWDSLSIDEKIKELQYQRFEIHRYNELVSILRFSLKCGNEVTIPSYYSFLEDIIKSDGVKVG